MSDLRNKLTTAKDDYQSLKYPGDIMADIAAGLGNGAWQPVHRSRNGWMYGAVAAAAVVGLSVLLNSGGRSGVQGVPTDGMTGGTSTALQQNPVVHWGGMNPTRSSLYGNSDESTAMTDGTPREVIFTNKIPQLQQNIGPMVPIDPRTGIPMPASDSRLMDYTRPRP